MEATVADDFQHSLDQTTLNSILSDLVDTSSGTEYEVERDKINHIVSKIRDIFINAGLKSDVVKAQCKSKKNWTQACQK